MNGAFSSASTPAFPTASSPRRLPADAFPRWRATRRCGERWPYGTRSRVDMLLEGEGRPSVLCRGEVGHACPAARASRSFPTPSPHAAPSILASSPLWSARAPGPFFSISSSAATATVSRSPPISTPSYAAAARHGARRRRRDACGACRRHAWQESKSGAISDRIANGESCTSRGAWVYDDENAKPNGFQCQTTGWLIR